MLSHERARRARPTVLTLAVAAAVPVATALWLLGGQPSAASPDRGAPGVPAALADGPRPSEGDASGSAPASRADGSVPGGVPGGATDGPAAVDDEVGAAADGSVPDGVTVFDDDVPAVRRLDPGLLDALRSAASDAAGDGVTFLVTSGWRSAGYQERLRSDAIAQYGSAQEAARWVADPRMQP